MQSTQSLVHSFALLTRLTARVKAEPQTCAGNRAPQGRYEYTIGVLERLLRSVLSFARIWESMDATKGDTRRLLQLRNEANV